ncbi:MAG: VOC family protein [Oscillatoria sp. SIO1A7]|nr:VOC family protein [Oscillatoria sp. SIO1A7]
MDANFPLELDHILVWVSPKAPEAQILAEFGLQRKDYKEHIGQGTASYFFFFENAYLELIWIDDEQAALDNAARTGIDLRSRASWRETGASAFGVGWRRRSPSLEELPLFPVKYSAEWMEPETYLELSDNFNQTTEPLYFIIPEYMSVPQRIIAEPIVPHPLGIKNVTSARVTLPQREQLSPVASELSRHTPVAFEAGTDSLLELTFDGGSRGQTLDARPTLPIVLKF